MEDIKQAGKLEFGLLRWAAEGFLQCPCQFMKDIGYRLSMTPKKQNS
jgi:hypothetical protein